MPLRNTHSLRIFWYIDRRRVAASPVHLRRMHMRSSTQDTPGTRIKSMHATECVCAKACAPANRGSYDARVAMVMGCVYRWQIMSSVWRCQIQWTHIRVMCGNRCVFFLCASFIYILQHNIYIIYYIWSIPAQPFDRIRNDHFYFVLEESERPCSENVPIN